jgi:ATP dependent DNA ligase domain
VHESKLDGYRCLAHVKPSRARLWSRAGTEWTDRLPELAGLTALGDVVLDGEVVVVTPDGRADFELLGARIHGSRHDPHSQPVTFYVFDVLQPVRPPGSDESTRSATRTSVSAARWKNYRTWSPRSTGCAVPSSPEPIRAVKGRPPAGWRGNRRYLQVLLDISSPLKWRPPRGRASWGNVAFMKVGNPINTLRPTGPGVFGATTGSGMGRSARRGRSRLR